MPHGGVLDRSNRYPARWFIVTDALSGQVEVQTARQSTRRQNDWVKNIIDVSCNGRFSLHISWRYAMKCLPC
jgi:hypothetical protein